ALAATLVHDPSTVLLDEPTAGIDPILRARLWEHLRSLAGSGHTVVVTTQYVGEAAHCDLVGLLTDGRLLHLDAPDGLRRAAEGGDRVRVVADGPIAEQVLADIGALDGVQDRVEQPEPSVVVAVVDDAATTDAVVACLTEAGLEVVDVDTQVVDWDEVFVRLVERAPDRAERATADGG
ncbi:MAG TPA: hypothetical protein VK866_06650, partial [Acidimicrobiales bacterium]|nr:hypothetical protein [Acidimicrobiales bacterium]